jgi:hypothetical protein
MENKALALRREAGARTIDDKVTLGSAEHDSIDTSPCFIVISFIPGIRVLFSLRQRWTDDDAIKARCVGRGDVLPVERHGRRICGKRRAPLSQIGGGLNLVIRTGLTTDLQGKPPVVPRHRRNRRRCERVHRHRETLSCAQAGSSAGRNLQRDWVRRVRLANQWLPRKGAGSGI